MNEIQNFRWFFIREKWHWEFEFERVCESSEDSNFPISTVMSSHVFSSHSSKMFINNKNFAINWLSVCMVGEENLIFAVDVAEHEQKKGKKTQMENEKVNHQRSNTTFFSVIFRMLWKFVWNRMGRKIEKWMAKINLMLEKKYIQKLAYLNSWFEFTFSFREIYFRFLEHFSAGENGNEKFHKLFKLALVKYIWK